MDLKSLLEEFMTNCRKHSESSGNGDYLIANKCFDRIVAIASELKQMNSLSQLETLSEDDYSVQLWVATYLIHDNPELSK